MKIVTSTKTTLLKEMRRRLIESVFGAWGVVLVLGQGFWAFEALAAGNPESAVVQAADSPSPAKPSGGPAEVPGPAEMARVYEKANEQVILNVLYLESHLSTLKSLEQDSSPSQSSVRNATDGFCVNENDTTDLKKCLGQYIDLETTRLEKLRMATIQHQDAILRLKSTQYGPDGKPLPKTGQDLEPGKYLPAGTRFKDTLMTKIPSFVELTQGANGKPLSPQEISKWVIEMTRAPKPEDFVKTVPVPQDASNPKKGNYRLILRDEKGNPLLDAEAYQKALKAYQDRKSGQGKEEGRYKYRVGSPNADKKNLEDRVKTFLSDPKNATLTWKEWEQNSGSLKDDYRASRKRIIDYINKDSRAPAKTDGNGQKQDASAKSPAAPVKPKSTDADDEVQLNPPKRAPDGSEIRDAFFIEPDYIDSVIDDMTK